MEREQATKFMYDLLRALLAKKGSLSVARAGVTSSGVTTSGVTTSAATTQSSSPTLAPRTPPALRPMARASFWSKRTSWPLRVARATWSPSAAISASAARWAR